MRINPDLNPKPKPRRNPVGRLMRQAQTLEFDLPTPFDSVENTQEYFALLCETLIEVKQEIDRDIATALSAKELRRLEALRLVQFKVHKLEDHAKASSLLLNDLRTLRRLLLQERVKPDEAKLT